MGMPALPKSFKDLQKKGPPLTEQLVAWILGGIGGCLVFGAITIGITIVTFAVAAAVGSFDVATTAGLAWGVAISLVIGPLFAGTAMLLAVGAAEKRAETSDLTALPFLKK